MRFAVRHAQFPCMCHWGAACCSIQRWRSHQACLQVAFTIVLLFQLRNAPWAEKLAHTVSLAQTSLAMLSNAAWLFIIAPLFFPNVPMSMKLASVLTNTPSFEAEAGAAAVNSMDSAERAPVSSRGDRHTAEKKESAAGGTDTQQSVPLDDA